MKREAKLLPALILREKSGRDGDKKGRREDEEIPVVPWKFIF